MKVLIIDDEKLDLFIAKKLLEPEFEVNGFNKLSDALAWVQSNEFDVALIDYYLDDGVVGLDILKKIQEIKGRSFKAILLSNHVDDDQLKKLRAEGFHNVIFKPISLEKFKEVLK
jgi:DNA-binding NtrC family response regulator